MKTITNDYKENVKLFGRELDSIITYELNGETIELGTAQLNSVTPHYESDILKSAMKQLDIDSNVEIPIGATVNYQFGIKVDEDEDEIIYEYINYGNYIVRSVEKQEDTLSYKITCYDKMLYAMTDYENMNLTYPITIRSYINAICTRLGLTFKNSSDTFANYDKEIQKELYLDDSGNSLGYTFRDVLDELSQVTASTICINEIDDELEIRYINNTQDTIDEEYLKDINVKFGEKYGPINSVVFTRAEESDSVYLRDDESVSENGLCEIKIKDNQILNWNDRSDYLQDILDQLNGLEYYINDYSSTGITYYEMCDMYNVVVGENIYNCLMLNDETLVTQGLVENVNTPMPETSETDYSKSDKTDRRVNQTYIIANKNSGDITALTSRTISLEEQASNTYTIQQTNELIQNAQNGVTNTFSEAGGNNVFRNTGLWFENDESDSNINPYEFWKGIAVKGTNDNASNYNSIILQDGNFSQEQEVSNGNYSISFNYQKLIELATASVVINDVEYPLDSLTVEQFYTGKKDTETDEYITQPIVVSANHLKIEFRCDTDNAVEIYDLMANKGTVKLAYSQNENETTTDTVNISKGITITSSNMDTIFKANANGIRILTLSGNLVAYFTEKGLSTKEIIVETKAEIVGTLWQQVDSQTWITRM